MASYGIWQERDLDLDALAADVDREALLDAQRQTIATHNADVDAIQNIFTAPKTKNQGSVRNSVGEARMQPLDENGRPYPIKGRSSHILGWPLYKNGTAEGYNFWTHEQMTVQDFADSLDLMLRADVNTVRTMLLSALYYNGAGFSFVDDAAGESVIVYGLANADTIVYDKDSGAATDDHYLAQGSAIADASNPYPTIQTELLEHPGNAGRIVSFIPSGLETTTVALASFAERRVDTVVTVPAAGSAVTDPLFAPPLNLPLSSTMRHIGTVGSVDVVVWNQLPANYIISVAVDADVKPIARREYPQASLRGLINVGEPMARFPYQQNNYLRAIGFGSLNRVAACITRISSGSYAVPTGYTYPGLK